MMRGVSVMDAARGCLAGLLMGLACVSWAQSSGRVDDALRGQYAVSLEQLSRYAQWRLRGVDDRRGTVFGLRSDEHIKGLQLDLSYRYSTALLDNLSHLNVVLNGEVVASLPLPKRHSEDEEARAKVELPISYLQRYNSLELQLIGHYTMECEDPLHADLWVEIDEASRLVFDVERIVLPDELGLLPSPIFDLGDIRGLNVPFVLGNPSERRLEAAGVVASWLGALAGYRGAVFTVDSAGIPAQGHAIVILGANESVPGLAPLAPQGPTVAMRMNPNDSAGKLLVITGRDDDEIRTAAVSLALGAGVLSGSSATVSELAQRPREPYDAPNWLPSDRPVELGELLPLQELSVSGFNPGLINIGLRLPPDLSDWRVDTVPLKLFYQHSATDGQDKAALDVLINQQSVKRIELANNDEVARRWLGGDVSALEDTVLLPLSMLQSQAALQFQFRYPPSTETECSGGLVDIRRSAIDPRSTIDLSHLAHHKAMPDLATFGTSGFPFTRMADLSETVVVLPAVSGSHVYSAYLSLMGKMGQVTGYPATGITVARSGDALKDRDVLLLEAGGRSELLNQWQRYLPTPLPAGLAKFGGGNGIGSWVDAFAQWGSLISLRAKAITPSAPPAGAYIAGFESPRSSGRSTVVVAGADGPSLRSAVELLIQDGAQKSRLQGSLAIVHDGRIDSVLDAKTYYVGSLGLFQTILWFLSKHPAILFVLYLLGAVLIAILMYLSLRARAQARLRAGTQHSNKRKENSR